MDSIDQMIARLMAVSEATRSLFKSIIAENGNRTDIIVRCITAGFTQATILEALDEWTTAGGLICERRDGGQVFYTVADMPPANPDADVVRRFLNKLLPRIALKGVAVALPEVAAEFGAGQFEVPRAGSCIHESDAATVIQHFVERVEARLPTRGVTPTAILLMRDEAAKYGVKDIFVALHVDNQDFQRGSRNANAMMKQSQRIIALCKERKLLRAATGCFARLNKIQRQLHLWPAGPIAELLAKQAHHLGRRLHDLRKELRQYD